MPARVDLTGRKFGRLTAVKDAGSRRGRRLWLCRCDCGGTTKVVAGVLGIGKTKSCGCLNKEPSVILPKGEAAFNELYANYKCAARYKERVFSLDKHEFRCLTSSNCHYCGVEPRQSVDRKNSNGIYVYNGIDRVDSTKGYVTSNCVSCCKQCNIAKHNFTAQEFYDWAERVYKRRKTCQKF